MTLRRDRRGQAGQAVLLGAITLVLVAISVVGGIRYVGPKVTLHQQQAGTTNFNKVQKALVAFVARNYRLPCPADGTVVQGSATDGVENCTATVLGTVSATVPWKTIGITYTDSLDGFNGRIGYAPSKALVSGTPYKSPSVLTMDAIKVSTNGVAGSCSSTTNACAYVLISFGGDRAGAYLASGTRISAPSATTKEFSNSQPTAFAGIGGTGFAVWPYNNTQTAGTAYFDDLLAYETSKQICTELNGTLTSNKAIYCSANGQTPPNNGNNTDNLAVSASPGTISNSYSCGTGSAYCPGSTNAGSLANTLAFAGSGNGNVYAPGTNSATLVGGLGTVSVYDPYSTTSSIGIGNQNGQGGGGGDWIGITNTAGTISNSNCIQCFGSSYTQYMIPGQTLSYQFSNSYQSFAFVDYLVDGGAQVQVDGYAGGFNITANVAVDGTVTLVSPAAACSGSLSSSPLLADAIPLNSTVVRPNVATSIIPAGTTINGTPAGTTVPLSRNATLSQTNAAFAVTIKNIQGTLTNTGTTVTTVSPIAGLAIGDSITGTGIQSGTTIAAVNTAANTITLSRTATATRTSTDLAVPITITGTTVAGTATITSASSIVGLASGQTITGDDVATSAIVSNTLPGTPNFSLSSGVTSPLTAVTLFVLPPSFNITGPLSTASSQVTFSPAADRSYITVGSNVYGYGIPPGTTVTAVDPTNPIISLSQTPVVTQASVSLFVTPWTKAGTMIVSNGNSTNINASIPITGAVTSGSKVVQNVSPIYGLQVGATIGGTGMAPGATITAVDTTANTVMVSQNATITGNTALYVTAGNVTTTPVTGTVGTTGALTTISGLTSTVGLSQGQNVTGFGIPAGTTISSINTTNASLTMSQSSNNSIASGTSENVVVQSRTTTSFTGNFICGTRIVTNLSPSASSLGAAGLTVGEFIVNSSLPIGTLITAIDTVNNTVSISQNATQSLTTSSLIAGYSPAEAGVTLAGDTDGATSAISNALLGLGVGQTVTSTGITSTPNGSVVQAVTGGTTTPTAVGNSATLTQPTTVVGTAASLFATYAPCPGPQTAQGSYAGLKGLYAAVESHASAGDAPNPIADPAPIPQHPPLVSNAFVKGTKVTPSQQWPQIDTAGNFSAVGGLIDSAPGNSNGTTPNGMTGNYIGQRDNQFYNRQFTDVYGTVQQFNILVFQLLPFTYTNGAATCSGATGVGQPCPYGNTNTYAYGMLFEGAKGCYTDINAATCTMAGVDEWWNPPVAETMDCGQYP